MFGKPMTIPSRADALPELALAADALEKVYAELESSGKRVLDPLVSDDAAARILSEIARGEDRGLEAQDVRLDELVTEVVERRRWLTHERFLELVAR